jgi:hypothetical protein
MTKRGKDSVPKKMEARYDEVVALTDAVCEAYLTDEYAQLCRRLAAKLSRKRPSPLARGRAKSWAAAIVYTVGRVNFLFDKSQTPHMRADELCRKMGVSQGTASAKSTQIMDMFGIFQMHPEWTLPSQMDDNPMAWMIMVNGLIVDVRHLPREIQEEAYRKGLIPYVPD